MTMENYSMHIFVVAFKKKTVSLQRFYQCQIIIYIVWNVYNDYISGTNASVESTCFKYHWWRIFNLNSRNKENEIR